jgi:RNA-directed DNA polymerase
MPQGGPLSPLLSNPVLDQLDRELERRGHRFAQYADDCNIYVRSRRAGQRLMGGLTRLLEGKLKLKVNREKSAVARPWERKFLGFSFTNGTKPKRRIAPKAGSSSSQGSESSLVEPGASVSRRWFAT